MDLAFDHLVWFSRRPEEAVPLMNKMGFHAVNGGRHEDWGTYNSLSYFGLSYIEFLGIENRAIAEKINDNRLVKQIAKELPYKEGPARIALRTNDIEKVAAEMKKQGVSVYGPYPGSRMTTDGTLIEWSLLFPEDPTSELYLPFIIQWQQSDHERKKQLKKQGAIGSHSLGDPELHAAGFVVKDLDDTVGQWQRLLGLEAGDSFIDKSLNAKGRSLDHSGTRLCFYSPAGEGTVARELASRGERPFLVSFRNTNKSEDIRIMDGVCRFK